MTSSDDFRPQSTNETTKPDRPLLLRLYASPHLVELVRLFGERELPKSEAEQAVQPLIERFGKARIQAAADEVLIGRDVDGTTWFRLSDDVRRMAGPILGFKPTSSATAPVAATPPTTPPTATLSAGTSQPFSDDPQQSGLHQAEDARALSVPTVDQEPRGFGSFENFLVHFWLTGDAELCRDLIDAACEEIADCHEVLQKGWSIKDAEVYYVGKSLREFAEQEALCHRTEEKGTDFTQQILDHIDWWEIANALLSDE